MDRHVLEAMRYQDAISRNVPRSEFCGICERELIERDEDIWCTEDGTRTEAVERDGEVFCGQKCYSQHIYDTADALTQSFLRAQGRRAYEWFRNVSSQSDALKLAISAGAAKLIHPTKLRMLDAEMHELAKDLFGEDFLNGKDDPPAWAIAVMDEMGGVQ